MVRLSVLDQSPIAGGRRPADAWAESLQTARAFGTDAVVALTIRHDFGARLRAYDLLAEAFGLDRVAA